MGMFAPNGPKLSGPVLRGRSLKDEGVSHVLDLSEGSSKLIPIHEEPNHQIVHLFRLGKANRPTH
jgi:hypothetical protein